VRSSASAVRICSRCISLPQLCLIARHYLNGSRLAPHRALFQGGLRQMALKDSGRE
jgi:hypothetical protein